MSARAPQVPGRSFARVALALLALGALVAAQATDGRPRNLDFEQEPDASSALPGWFDPDVLPPAPGEGYLAERVSDEVHGGRAAARLRRLPDAPETARFGVLAQSVPSTPWLGRRLRLSGWLRTDDVTSGAGLWMRVDGEGTTLAFDNMSQRFLSEDTGWTRVEVVLDVDPAALRVAFGLLLLGAGSVWIDDLAFDVVDASVPTTALLSRPAPDDTPAPEAVRDWITRRAVRLATLDPDAPSTDDLAALPMLVGDARLVVIGEPVRATHELLGVQRRLIERLVEDRGFDVIAVDAGVAEMLYLGLYVTRGHGDPRALAREVLPWHRQSEEFLAFVEWLRGFNASRAHKVRLVGVEALGVAAGLRSLTAFLERVGSPRAASLAEAFAPLEVLEEQDEETARPSSAALARARAEVSALLADFEALASAWDDATSPATTARARRLATVLGQVAAMADEPGRSDAIHVEALLDNTLWLLEQEPDAKVVLLVHDRLLLRGGERASLGDLLHERLGDRAVLLATTVRAGGFRAWGAGGAGIEAFELPEPPRGGLEAAFPDLGSPAVLLDLRAVPPAGPVRAWFEDGQLVRLVDGFFLPRSADLFLEAVRPSAASDLLLQVERVSPDERLPDDD